MLSSGAFVGFLSTTDLARAKAFYVDTLGLTVVDESPWALVLASRGTQIRVTPVTTFAAQPFTVAGWTVVDIAAEVRELRAAGVHFAIYEGFGQDELGVWTTPGGDKVAWFTDPDDNVLSLTQHA